MKSTFYFIVVAYFVVTSTAGLSAELEEQQPYARNAKIDVEHYDFKAVIPVLSGPTFTVVEGIRIRAIEPSANVKLHIEPSSIGLTSVTQNGSPLQYEIIDGIRGTHDLSGKVLKIDLPQPVQADAVFELTLTYTLNIAAAPQGLKYTAAFNSKRILNSTNWPYYTRFWLPSNDNPEDPATINYEVHVPNGMIAAANGALVEGSVTAGSGLDEQGLRVFKWHQSEPIYTYGFNLVVGELQVYEQPICFDINVVGRNRLACEDAPSQIPFSYYFQGNSPIRTLPAAFEQAVGAAVFFSSTFGMYPFQKIGYVIAPQPFFMESPSMITLPRIGATVHELVHQWWGTTVRIKSWMDFWINEGFTTYFTGFYDEVVSGTNTASLCPGNTAPLNFISDIDPKNILDNTPYCKGAYAIDQLRRAIDGIAGLTQPNAEEQRVFLKLMSNLFQRYRFRPLGTQELVDDLRVNLSIDLHELGYTVSTSAVNTALTRWKDQVFVGIR